MKRPERERAGRVPEGHDVIRRTGRRQRCAGQVRRQKTAVIGADAEALLSGRSSRQHARSIIRANFAVQESGGAGRKHVKRDVIRIGPDTHLWIVWEIRILEGITVIRPRGIAAGGDSNALEIWCGAN